MDSSLSSLLSTLQESILSAVLPAETAVLPQQNGISLLDLKNELFLSYLQNLVFLILIKLRHATNSNDEKEQFLQLNEEATKKLAELRLYLEKGVKPLEGRLKYQIDKVVRAADDSATAQSIVNSKPKLGKPKKAENYTEDSEDSSESSEESEDIDELSYRPNPAALIRTSMDMPKSSKSKEPSDGIYKPPRITATAMPTTRTKGDRSEKRTMKSATLDEFIATELSTAPMAEPSIGSTIVAGGRRVKSQRERDDDVDRRRFEEEMLMRLPEPSKKDKARKGQTERRGGFGGEEWRDLGAGLDRIENLTKRKSGSGGQLEKSRKRKIDVADGPRDSGAVGNGIGSDFAKRKRTVLKRFR